MKNRKRIGYGLMLALACGMINSRVSAQSKPIELFPLEDIKLLSSPFLVAQQTDLNYMLKLDPDRLLAPFLRESGLTPKAKSYGNWEDSGLDGHTAGHYLTALAQMYAATGDPQCLKRINYMVDELARCQQNNKNGYVGGVPGGMAMWAEVKNGDFSSFNKKWVPWYNMHKLYAGLRDCWLLAHNEKAKIVLVKLSDWAAEETAGLTPEQMQRMLNTEHGGMNEVFADVADITGNKKYLKLAQRFCHQAILQPLEKRQDKLTGLHANTQIPKIIGFERISELNQDTAYHTAARFFWKTVVDNRTISIGGNSVREHFNPSDNFLPMLESEQGPETCNSNNMLKLTKMLFLYDNSPEYMEFYERLLYNHILSSEHPVEGGFVYFTPIHPRHYRVYSTADESFWCCVGTGMENHGKYGELIYAHQGKDIYVNLFIPSVLNWSDNGITLKQENNFPDRESTRLMVTIKKPQQFNLSVRKPSWATGGFAIKVNGKIVKAQNGIKGYLAVNRLWKTGDVVTIALPMKNSVEYLPDHSGWVSFLHGPIVLAAPTDTTDLLGLKADDSRWGHIARGKLYDFSQAPLIVDKGGDLAAALTPVKGSNANFSISPLIYQAKYKNLKLIPFYKLHDARYMLYWPVANADSISQREQQLETEDKLSTRLASRIVDGVNAGEQQPEVDHGLNSQNSNTGIINNRHWRDAGDFFSYKLGGNSQTTVLQISYSGKDRDRQFDVYINGQNITHINVADDAAEAVVTKEFKLPDGLAKTNKVLEVKFVATGGKRTAPVYSVKLLR
ncbi:glycoside hydrolase family 127 protein [Mucilaginibacter sp. RS28]|uniref:Glycoside hydrolase family 127 protein n=1 Tax=Mucilaginibacter straminoryzae TaxID=2932774 RepID=A0A9X2BC80_9SPHI|nr:glycoside hydrolase family 127 protein [Mucilaginibacter straminoryzae]MCJ8209013.1 glycoside hydrolase family 127 protein [Mucilaginibacter straminoryzae]